MHRLSIIFIAAFAFFHCGISLFAQEATAGLSSPATVVGRPVEIVVTVRDARSAEVPQSLNVPGLRIELLGRSTRFEMNNFKITSSLTYTYSVLPQQAGEFDIPAVEVRVGDKTLKTNPLRISVADASAMQPPQGLPNAPAPQMPSAGGQVPRSNGLPYFGELLLSKKKAFVGEVIPAEFRYYFNSSIGGEVGDRPNLVGEGFTVQKLANVPKREQIVNGENYIVFAFQTAITPAKSGPLEIPPAKLEARLQLPSSAPAGFDDFFRQFGGIAPPGMFTNMQEVGIETAPTALEISPLPKQGRPDDFSGAIGKFKMEASVSPKKAGPGARSSSHRTPSAIQARKPMSFSSWHARTSSRRPASGSATSTPILANTKLSRRIRFWCRPVQANLRRKPQRLRQTRTKPTRQNLLQLRTLLRQARRVALQVGLRFSSTPLS
jgi:hypothetical protein